MKKIAIIGGSGFTSFAQHQDVVEVAQHNLTTVYGEPSAPLIDMTIAGVPLTFLPRHGQPHKQAPHLINYRANIAALKAHGVEQIIGVNAVGSIDPKLTTEDIVIPNQLIDYTWGRASTFFDGQIEPLQHIDFSYPFDENLIKQLAAAASSIDQPITAQGTYAATQGPRLETAGEIKRLAQDGNTLVGMTLMPEAALARELDIAYASLCLVVNPAAGVAQGVVSLDEIYAALASGIHKVQNIIRAWCLAR